jgi:heat shock protein HtpX
MNTVKFSIDTELSSNHLEEALDFIKDQYLKSPKVFKNISKYREDGIAILKFTVKDENNEWKVSVKLKATNPFQVHIQSHTSLPEGLLKRFQEEIFIAIQYFEEQIHQSTLYFAWVEGEKIIPEEPPSLKRNTSNKMFGSNLLVIYFLFFGINIILFIFLGFIAVLAILALQFVVLLLSDRIYLNMSHWLITKENPEVHILEYQLPLEEYKQFQEHYGKDSILKMKKEIYDLSLGQGQTPTCELGEDIFLKYGFQCNPQDRVSKVIDIYSIVKEAADSFNLPIPRIALSNTMIPNAAATGPSPSRGLILITTGLLVQLEEDEILSVVGHEMGHLAGRDPLILFGLVSGEFILRLTILLPLVVLNPLIYLFIALGLIYFVSKFFEARADLLSAMKIGKPEVLAEALRKIGYQRLQAERLTPSHVPGWLVWDPHPPIYFRIDRLDQMKKSPEVNSPLLQSAKDVINGFLSALGIR